MSGAFLNAAGLGFLGNGNNAEVDQAIKNAKAQMKRHVDRYDRLIADAGRTNDGTAARAEVSKFWDWATELAFIVDAQSNKPITAATADKYKK